MDSSQVVVVFITAASREEAVKLADLLLAARRAACVSVLPGVESFFRWQGNRETADETLLIAKTTTGRLAQLIETVKSGHSYQVPEIIALPVAGGNPDYLDWVARETCTRPEGE
jgi:periplasmic divalent cation tolerance protein